MSYCSNCGKKLVERARFCHACGFPVQIRTSSNDRKRKEQFVGEVLKCPNCGEVISETTAICPSCGIHITRRGAVYSVQEFKDQLMAIEMQRRKPKFTDIYTGQANPTDTQKLTLIRSFPIPNTVDDIHEFMLLAVANIDTRLSKQTTGSKLSSLINSGNVNATIQKTISDAWVSKMHQAYHKAEVSFPNDPMFIEIQKIYSSKLKELKMKIQEAIEE